jgi:hypothetical protein
VFFGHQIPKEQQALLEVLGIDQTSLNANFTKTPRLPYSAAYATPIDDDSLGPGSVGGAGGFVD